MRAMIKEYAWMIAIGLLFLVGFTAIALFIERESEPEAVSPIAATPFVSGEPDLIVDVRWLAENMANVDLIIDLSDRETYEAGHIPGAVHVWWQDAMPWHAANYGEGGALGDPAEDSLTLRYPQEASIVVYDNAASEHAAWFLWLLRTNGFGNARLLDGGFAAWSGAGQSVSTESRSLDRVADPDPTWIAVNEIETGELRDRLGDPALTIIDTRTAQQQQDTVNDTIRTGQIPGSLSVPAPSVVREDGTFKSPEELRELFSPLGLEQASEIAVYGRFGTETGRVWLALRLAGFENVRVYDEGWVRWGWDTSLPVEPVGTTPQRPVLTASPIASPVASPIATPVASPVASPVR